MKQNFNKAFLEVLRHEGGYVNDPHDSGGVTNLGCTKAVYEAWVGHPVSVEFMKCLKPDHVRTLYKVRYWDKVKCDDLPSGLDLCVFDFAINAGPRRAAKYLQLMVGATPDGIIGPATLAKVNQYVGSHNRKHAVNRYQDLREGYYKKLRQFPRYGRGWLRRVKEVRRTAEKMAK